MKHGKKYQDSVKAFDLSKQYEAAEAVSILLETAKAKFDETVEMHVRFEDPSRSRSYQESSWFGNGKRKTQLR